jgi:transposase
MSVSRRRFTQEFKDVAVAYGVGPETLRNWLIKYREANGGTETELTVSERARLKELEQENQELRAEKAFLTKVWCR